MKKILPFYFILILAPFMAFLLISNSNGANAGLTGSPGDNSFNCTVCHVGADTNTTFSLSTSITTNIPTGGYALGQTYTITVTQSTSGATKHGFEITAENSTNSNVGTFVITDAINTQLKGIANEYVTHTSAGSNLSSWTFDWTAPSSDVGAITFYVATIAGVGTGASGSQMVLKTEVISGVLGISDARLLHFTMYPNPSEDRVSFLLPSDINKAHVTIFDYLGKSLLQQNISTLNNNLDISNLSAGIYFVRIQTPTKLGMKKLIVR